jgi:hypothetical protein
VYVRRGATHFGEIAMTLHTTTPRGFEMTDTMKFSKLVALGLFILSLGVFLLTASGRGTSTDGDQIFYTAENLVLHRTIEIDSIGGKKGARLAKDGHYYSKYAPGLTVAEVPLFLGLSALTMTLQLENKTTAKVLRAWVPALLNIVLTAAILVLMYAVVLQLGYSSTVALIVSLLLGFTTPVWVYAKTDFSEPLQALFLLAVFAVIIRARPPISRAPFWTGFILALLILTKAIYVILAPMLLLALLWRLRATTVRAALIVSVSFGLPVLVGGLLYLAWNYARFGSPFDFGYLKVPFDTPLLVGLYGWLFSSGRSVFLYTPLLLLLIWTIPRFFKSHPFETVVIMSMTVPLMVLYSKFWAWHGGWAWSLRYAEPMLPLWILPSVTVLAFGSKAWKSAVAVLGALGLFVQVLGLSIDPGNYLSLLTFQVTPVAHPGQGAKFSQAMLDANFVPEFSPLAGHWWLFNANIERLVSPEKSPSENVALHTYPWWGRRERASWTPAHPEYGLWLNFWWSDLPYMDRTARRALLTLSFILALTGFGLIMTALRAANNTVKASGHLPSVSA